MYVDAGEPMRVGVGVEFGVFAVLLGDGLGDKGSIVEGGYGAFFH
jgi:hypothetical protein